MRNSILGFNQEDAIELGLTTDDLLILDYIIRANGTPNMHHIISDEVSYVWLSHQKIHEDLPILNITEGTLKNKLLHLKNLGLIQSKQIASSSGRGSKTFYSVTMTCVDMTTSRQNDVVSRPRHARMTSDNSVKSLDNTNISSNEDIYSSEGVCSENVSETKQYTKEDYRDEFLGSAKRRKQPVKKNSLYSNCSKEITNYCISNNCLSLVDVLHTYLSFRLSIKDKPVYNVAQWKAMLVKLDEVVKQSGATREEIINQSIEHGWASFYPPKSNNKRDVFSEYGQVTCEKSDGKESSGVEF